jgi:ankyrin repeat protein
MDIQLELNEAICKGQYEIVGELLNQGADINGVAEGLTPLMVAAEYGHLDIIQFLFDFGADVNQKYNGYTALMDAVTFDHPQAVKLLCLLGADTTVRDPKGRTLIEMAKNNDNVIDELSQSNR